MKKVIICMMIVGMSFMTFATENYMVELEFKQSSFTLSIRQHIKDAANAFSFAFPTTKEFYDSISVGQEISSKFKTASFLLSGNIGTRKVIVKKKWVEKK